MFYSIGCVVEPDTSLMLATGLGIAKAISSKRVDKRFVGSCDPVPATGGPSDPC
jgi:hypothetical protein